MAVLCGFSPHTHCSRQAGLSRDLLAPNREIERRKERGRGKERERRGWALGALGVIHNNVQGRKEMTHVSGVQIQDYIFYEKSRHNIYESE